MAGSGAVRAALGALAALAVAGCGAADGGPEPSPKKTVEITDAGFRPQKVTVPVGTRVTWVNLANDGHTAQSVGVPEVLYDRRWLDRHNKFDTHTIQPGEAESAMFDTPGRYLYFSSLNNRLVGLVTVVKAR